MRLRMKQFVALVITEFVVTLCSPAHVRSDSKKEGQSQQASAQAAVAKAVGAVKAINTNGLTVAPDSGADVVVGVGDFTRIVRVEPGQKDLKGATQLRFQDLQVGDRILVRGKISDDGKTLVAAAIIVMKHADVEAKQQKERDDWQKRGIGGLVKAVDASAGTITISAVTMGGTKSVAVHISKNTILRRYAPDSVKFDDAKPCMIGEIKAGDQLRARGDRNADGSELAAEEIVAGAFRNIAGTISAVDIAANTMTVKDLIAKESLVVRITPDTQLRKLPPEMSQRIAMRLKGTPPGSGAQGAPAAANAPRPQGGIQAGYSGGQHPNGAPDFQQMVNRMPTVALADFQKGDAVMIVSTEGNHSGGVTAISLLGGVEPILTASPNGQGMVLSPWSLGSSEGDSGTQ
jgi:hypothetical protein